MLKKAPFLLVAWFAALLATITPIAAFVAAVDPFGYFGNNTVGYYYSSERQFKKHLVRTADYNGLVLGDSRISYSNTAAINVPPFRFLNGGIGGSKFIEQIDLLFGSRLDELDLVVLGLNYGTLSHRPNCSGEPVVEESSWDPLRYSTSWTQAWYASNALYLRAKGDPPTYYPDGTRNPDDWAARDEELTEKTPRYWATIKGDADLINLRLKEGRPGFRFADTCVELVQRARDLGRKHGFRVMVVMLPVNRDLLDRIDAKAWFGGAHTRASMDQLRRVLPEIVDFHDSPYSDSANFFRHDATHFKPEIGAQLIREAINRLK